MSKAITGAVELAGAAVLDAVALYATGGIAAAWQSVFWGLVAGGIASEASAIAQALGSKSGLGVATRAPAALRQIIRGERRIGGTIVYQSTTGGTHRQYNMVIVLATHPCEAIVNLYLDGRQVYFQSGLFNRTRNGVNFGGDADSSDHIGPSGQKYNFGGKVFCEAFYGDQTSAPDQVAGVLDPTGGYSTALNANDATWAPTAAGTPYLPGCTWIYLKLEADQGTFPQFPEIRATMRGKNDIYDPRTGTTGYTHNWALHIADAITDPVWGLGDDSVNQAQLIAAANVCDEQVACAAGFEDRYALHYAYDTGTSPGDAIQRMMPAAAGRLSRAGGEWYIWPAYWQGPGFTFDENSLLDAIQWNSKRSFAELVNRVTGTYVAPNYPYNTAGNLYDSNGYWNGSTPNTFPYAFQPTNFPMYAADVLHGYSEDVYLVADTPNQGAWNSGTAYAAGAVIIYSGAPWKAKTSVPAGNAPSSISAYWSPTGNFLPMELNLDTVLSVSQAQRLAKIALMRNRQQGNGTLVMRAEAFQMMPVDVMQFNCANLGWTNKVLEIAGASGAEMKVRYAPPPRAAAGESQIDNEVNALWLEVPFNETDPSVYDWSPSEELTPYVMPALSGAVEAFIVAPPTSLAVTDTASTAVVRSDGSLQPRVLLTWTAPNDTYVTNGGSIQVQWRDAAGVYAGGAWVDVGLVSGQAGSTFFEVDSSVANIDVQVRSVRPNGGYSDWTQLASQNVVVPGGAVGAVVKAVLAAPNGGTTYTVGDTSPVTFANPGNSLYFTRGIKRLYGTDYSISGATLTILISAIAPQTGDTHELYGS